MSRDDALIFENVWGKASSADHGKVMKVWGQHGGPIGDDARERLSQLVFLVKDADQKVVGISTAFKTYVKHLRNYFFLFRVMVVPMAGAPGVGSRLLLATRDFLESIHGDDLTAPAVGLLTIVNNEALKQFRNEAIWPASGMVYIGNNAEGHHMRVYYFPGARIAP